MISTMTEDNLLFLRGSVVDVARRLIGCHLIATLDDTKVILRIVETEAYDQNDAASHSYKGRTPRTDVMFGPAGHLYVYFTYGMHYCCNIVTGLEGEGSAVLIRAAEVLEGREVVERYRKASGVNVTNGPAKLCQALGIAMSLNGHDLHDRPLQLLPQPPVKDGDIATTERIGISKAKEKLWRFYLKNNPYVSKLS